MTRRYKQAAFGALAIALLTTLSACGDPFRENRIEALGDENPAFPESDIHRPGQPCTWCHDSFGEAEPLMSMGGTLFYKPADAPPYVVANYIVRLLDSEGNRLDVRSNRCGNFWVEKETFDPAYPVRVELFNFDPNDETKLQSNQLMSSRVAREGSCGGCHKHPSSPFSPGVVFVSAADPPEPPSATQCPPPTFAPQL